MIIMIRTLTAMLQQFLTVGTESSIWKNDFPGQQFLSLALWHILLFAIVFIIFHESRSGFKKSISIIARLFHWSKRKNRETEVNYTISRFRENSRNVYLSNALFVITCVLFIAFILYIKLIFFTVVISDSMNPSIEKGDLVLMQNVYVKPQVGDIIYFKVPDVELPVTHRIISISGTEMRTRGDSNPNEDTWRITNTNIHGKIVIMSGKPVIIKNLGKYFLIDASQRGRTYSPEFNAMSTLIQGIKFTGFIIFSVCVFLYLIFSIRDSRRAKW